MQIKYHYLFNFLLISTFHIQPVSASETTDAITVTASRFPTTIPTTANNITIISAEQIKRSNSHTLSQTLESIAGVQVNDLFGISGSTSTIDLSGFGATGSQNTLILLNGRRLNDVDLSGANLAAIPFDSIERVEIINGASTVLYGDNASGGVINIVTKSGFDEASSSISLIEGSYDTTKFSTAVYETTDMFAVSYFLEYFDSNGYRDNSNFNNINTALDISQQSDFGLLGLRLLMSEEDLGLPGALSESLYQSTPEASTFTLQSLEESRHSVETFLNSEHYAGELSFRQKRQTAIVFGSTLAELNTASFTPRTNFNYKDFTIISGIDFYRSTLNTLADFSPSASNSSTAVRKSLSAYVSTIYKYQNSNISLGYRRQNVKLDLANEDLLSLATTKDNDSDSENSWDITLSQILTNNSSLYIKRSAGFRYPVLDEMWSFYSGSINILQPQKSQHIEMGGKYLFGKTNQFQASLFNIDLTNEIAYNALNYSNENIVAPTRHSGVNTQIHLALNPLWNININANFRRATYLEGINQDKDIPQIPKTKISLSQEIVTSSDNSFSIDTIYTGSRYFADDNNNAGKRMEPFTMINVGYKQAFKDWHGGISIQNLTNVKTADQGFYVDIPTVSTDYYYYPLPARSVFIELIVDI